MYNPTVRSTHRPQPTLAPVPTLVRTPRDSSLFRGWGVTL
jgi:hypothetical protein